MSPKFSAYPKEKNTRNMSLAIRFRLFTPKPQDVSWSRRIIEAHAAATARGEGVVVVDGRLVENLHVESARRVVSMADAIAAMAAASA